MPFATLTGTAGPPKGKDLKYLRLFDQYGALLSETRREICEMYFMLDLSLSEIAEQKQVSRQSVSEVLKTSREELDFYEEKLHHSEQDREYSLQVSLMLTETIAALNSFKQEHPEFSREMDEIIDIVAVGEKIDLDKEN